MASYGFDFRQTQAYVTDPTGCTYSIGDAYPQTRNGITFGWSGTAPTSRNRSTSVDARLAGVNFASNSGTVPLTFRVDLPATGTYSVGCAMGDAGFPQDIQYVEIFDNTTSKLVMQSAGAPAAGSFYDLAGNVYTAANFFANQTPQSITFATTTMFVKIGKTGVGNASFGQALAHLVISQSSAAVILPPMLLESGMAH